MQFHNPVPLILGITTLLGLLTPSEAYYRGFNIKSNLADGRTCKSPSDYLTLFQRLKTFPNNLTSTRLYHSHTCTTLLSAIPAAVKTHTTILVGIDAHPSKFSLEKGALLQAIKQYGWTWISGISVGSEDLYRGTIAPAELAERIYDVRGMLAALPGYAQYKDLARVGHVDTTDAWTNSSNIAVIRASEFIGADIYPYFQSKQNNSIENAPTLFWNGLEQVLSVVRKASVGRKGGVPSVWVAETGWPVNGVERGLAVPGRENARAYWKGVACGGFEREGEGQGRGLNTFWFTVQDWSAVPSFAVLGEQGEELFDMRCP